MMDIRQQLYVNLGIEPLEALLLSDEAHNCGEVLQDYPECRTNGGGEAWTRHCGNCAGLKKQHRGAEAVRHVLPRIRDFMHG
jgi:DNA excision repair protein ERCC-2